MSFEINKPTIKVEDTIHYLVTRPIAPVVDDGNGNYNISPIGFPVRDTSGELGVIPTRITPEFVATYNNLMGSFNVSYTSNKPISELYGSMTIQLLINTLTYSSGTVTATSLYKHGYVNGASVTISGVDQLDYNGTFTITVVDDYTFTYALGTIPSLFIATGNKKSSYTLSVGDVIELVAQDDNKANGYYIVETYVWRTLYLVSKSVMVTKANIYTNVNITSAVAPVVTANIASITSETTGTDIKSAVVITTVAHGFSSGSSITISGSSVSAYNGTKTIDVVNTYTFRYSIPTLQSTDSSGLATASYQTLTNDLVLLLNQTNSDENGIYYVKSGSKWDYFGDFYKYNGTENDNVAGDYGNLSDSKGNKLNHYRNGYSLKETADFLRKKLDSSIEFGKFVGKSKDIDKQGALVQWLLSGRKINIGKTADKSIIVDGFGLGNKNNTLRNNRTWGEVDPFDVDAINAEKISIAKQKQTALWGLTNHHSRTLEGYNDKSPYVKDYPFVYNSVYDAGEIEPQLTGGHIDLDVDVERMRLSATGTTSTTDINIRPIAIDTVWYHRENSYHNNITLDRSNTNVFGKHAISLINNFDTPDFVAIYDQKFISDNVTVGHSTYIELDDVSEFTQGDYVRFIFPIGTDSIDGIDQSTTYKIATGYPTGHTIKIVNIDNSEVVTTYKGSGTFTIQRVAFDLYSDNEVVASLNNLCSIVLNSGDILCLKTTTGTVTKYYIKPRSKRSLTSLATKGSWSATTLSYDANGTNGINIYLNSSETDYVTFTHQTKTTAELLSDLNYNNDLIPVPFSATTNPIHLTELFVRNSLVDYSDDVYNSEKIRSKKTFIHLPTSLDLKDGTPIELDISLPTVPNTDSFKFNTVGSLSGYKNYVTQPRAYVFGGYHTIKCDLVPVVSITSNGTLATLTTETPHELHTTTFTTTDIDISNSSIAVTSWKNIEVDEFVTFASAGTLPITTPQIVADTKYKIKSIIDGRITLATTSNVDITISSIGVGIQYITLCKPVKITIKGSLATEYNDVFMGSISSRSTIQFSVDSTYSTSVTNENIFISKSVIVNGTEGTYGLTERNNNAIFGSMPEAEYASENNIYHQSFTPDNIVGSSYVDSDGVSQIDKRVLLATVYPTSTSTFQWRMDNDPQLRMLQWSMLNVNAGGGSDETGSFANVAYKRNKAIFNEFNTLYKDGDNGLFSVYNNPLSYVSLLSPDFTQQQINAMVKVRFPETIGTILDSLTVKTVASFNYQANIAYIDLIRDFITARVRVKDVKDADDYIYILQESTDLILAEDDNDGALITEFGAVDTNTYALPIISYAASLPLNHGTSNIPTSFYDHNFFKVDSLVSPYSIAAGYDADSRWNTKEIYIPEYIYNASGDTAYNDDNVFHNMPSALTTHMETYYFKSNKYESNAGDRYVVGDLSPTIDPVFAFGYATSNKFISFITGTTTDSKVNDVKRKLWDSYFEIPNARQRQMQNAYYIDAFGATVEDTVKFHGAYWIPFAKMFSTDGINPVNPNIIDITSYSTITGGSYANVNSTLNESLKSNPIATRFIEHGYEDAFSSVNSRETVTSNEEFIRNYVAGYSNKLPLRFYNGYKIMIAGKLTSTSYETDLSNPVVITEIDSERIYRYSLRDYLTEYSESPSTDNGMYMDDNFLIYNTPTITEALIDSTSLYSLIDSGEWTASEGTVLELVNWDNLDGWTPQGTALPDYGTDNGYGATTVYNNELHHSGIGKNPTIRYNTQMNGNFVAECYIYAKDDQSLYFMTNQSLASNVGFYNAISVTYFQVIFDYSGSWWSEFPTNHVLFAVRKDAHSIDLNYNPSGPDYYGNGALHKYDFDVYDIGEYVPGTMYRVLFGRLSDNTCMIKIFNANTNEMIGSFVKNVKIPNILGQSTPDSLALSLGVGQFGGYYGNVALANNLTDGDVNTLFGVPASENVTVRDPNPAWWYFENGNPNLMPTSSKIKSAITVSGMNYLADRKFYINKMEFNYTRIKMSFVFSAELGRWLPLDYRQAPTAYLTPTFGATALGEKEKSIIFAGTSGKYAVDYVPINYTVGGKVVNTIDNGSYPIDARGNLVLDYLWKNPLCTDSSNVYTQLSDFGYWEMPPMELNQFCYPFLSDEFPYNTDGTLVDELNYSKDVYGSDIYRFTRLIEPNKASPVGINFVVPNNVYGGEFDADNDLFMYQPHMWKVYWHMRPVVCSMDGTDIPTADARTGGVMADPVLNNIYTYPNPRDPQFYIPWHEDMNTDWLNAGWLISDGKIRNDSNSDRDEYYEFDGE